MGNPLFRLQEVFVPAPKVPQPGFGEPLEEVLEEDVVVGEQAVSQLAQAVGREAFDQANGLAPEATLAFQEALRSFNRLRTLCPLVDSFGFLRMGELKERILTAQRQIAKARKAMALRDKLVRA